MTRCVVCFYFNHFFACFAMRLFLLRALSHWNDSIFLFSCKNNTRNEMLLQEMFRLSFRSGKCSGSRDGW